MKSGVIYIASIVLRYCNTTQGYSFIHIASIVLRHRNETKSHLHCLHCVLITSLGPVWLAVLLLYLCIVIKDSIIFMYSKPNFENHTWNICIREISSYLLQKMLHLIFIILTCFLYFQERDKLYLSRCIIFELVQALKFKAPLPDENLIKLVQVSPQLSTFVWNLYLGIHK